MLDIIQRYHLGLEIDVAEFLQDSHWIVASFSPPAGSNDSTLTRGRTRCFAFGRALSQSTNLFSHATVVFRVVVEGHEEKLFKIPCASYAEIPKHPSMSASGSTRESRRGSDWRASWGALIWEKSRERSRVIAHALQHSVWVNILISIPAVICVLLLIQSVRSSQPSQARNNWLWHCKPPSKV